MLPEISALFVERFPRYTFAILEWAPSPRRREILPLKNLPLDRAQILYLYGLNGETALHLIPWLLSNPARKLIFLEPDTGRIAAFLEEPFAKEILSQKQIEIYHLPKKKGKSALIQELSFRHSIYVVFICFCAGDRKEFARLKLLLLRASASAFACTAEVFNFHTVLSSLKENCPAISYSSCASSMKDAFASVPAIICGAGPSLQKALDTLRALGQRALIIAGGSAITALSLQGIEPHFAVAVDPTDEEFERLKNSCAFQTPLFFPLRLNSSCLAAFNGPLGYIRTHLSGIIPWWIEKDLDLSTPLIDNRLPPESYSVTMISAALAYHFGCNPILLEGIDLAYTQNRRYADGIEANELPHALRAFDTLLTKQSKSGAKVSSAVRWVMEATALSKFARRCKDRRWIQCTSDGLTLKDIESMPLAEAALLFPEERDLAGLVHQALSLAPIPEAVPKHFTQKLQEMESGLDRMLEHLDALVQGKPGLAVLSELEIQEDPLYQTLFHMFANSLRLFFPNPENKADYWKTFQFFVQRCRQSLLI